MQSYSRGGAAAWVGGGDRRRHARGGGGHYRRRGPKLTSLSELRELFECEPAEVTMHKYGGCDCGSGGRCDETSAGFCATLGDFRSGALFIDVGIQAHDELETNPRGTLPWQAVERRQWRLLRDAAARVHGYTMPEVRMAKCALMQEPNGCAVIVGTAAELGALLRRTEVARAHLELDGIPLPRNPYFVTQAVPLSRLLECLEPDRYGRREVRSLYAPPAGVADLGVAVVALPTLDGLAVSVHHHMEGLKEQTELHECIRRLPRFADAGEEPHVLVFWERTEDETFIMKLSLPGGKRNPGELSSDAAIRRAGRELWCGAFDISARTGRSAVERTDLEVVPHEHVYHDTVWLHVFALKSPLPEWRG